MNAKGPKAFSKAKEGKYQWPSEQKQGPEISLFMVHNLFLG